MSELINRQAFIENERKLYCEDCDRRKGKKDGKLTVCYEIGEAPCRACWLDDALTDLEDFPTASPWHRVDEPPKYTGRYVVWCGVNWYGEGMHDEFMTANYNTVSGRWSVDRDKTIRWPLIGDITYWMPIEPPKEEQPDEFDPCYECGGYGDDYRIDEDGELVSNCPDCPFNKKEDA